MDLLRLAVVGAGAFGRNHLRVIHGMEGVKLAGVCDQNANVAAEQSAAYGCPVLPDLDEVAANADAAVIATPTRTHAAIALQLMSCGVDVLVEKPIASSTIDATSMRDAASRYGRILQVGHLERFNPAVDALSRAVTHPLFFEVHRMSLFHPRSLDVDVILDLMIHDLDIVLSMTGKFPAEIRAAGISILSDKVDIANVRLAFEGGCIANLTASRVSTEKIRKIRVFQPDQYFSIDYARRDGSVFHVLPGPEIRYEALSARAGEPLALELEHFVQCCRERRQPRVGGKEASDALRLALAIQEAIDEHSQVVRAGLGSTLEGMRATSVDAVPS